MLSVACAARPRLQNALRGVQALPPFVTEVACVGHPPRSDGQQRHPLLPMPACVGVPLAPPPTPRYAATQRHHGRQPHRRRRMLGVRLAQEPCAGLTPWTFPTRTVPTPRNEAAGGACCPTAGVRNRRSASQKVRAGGRSRANALRARSRFLPRGLCYSPGWQATAQPAAPVGQRSERPAEASRENISRQTFKLRYNRPSICYWR